MFEIEKYRKKLNEYIEIENDPYSDIEFVEASERLVDEICKDQETFNGFVEHMKEDIGVNEYIAITEISYDLATKYPSKEYWKALLKLRNKYPEETKKYKVVSFVNNTGKIIRNRLKKQKEEKERMKILNYEKFLAYLIVDAEFEGKYNIPIIQNQEIKIPKEIVPFEKRNKIEIKDRKNTFVHFYMNDNLIDNFVQHAKEYVQELKHFGGIISPDPSLCIGIPLAIQLYHTYINRACAYFFQKEGLKVIPNVRWADKESFEFCFAGLKPNGTYSISTLGCIKNSLEKTYFKNGLDEMLKVLEPERIIVHGGMPERIFAEYEGKYNFIHFDSWITKIHRERKNKEE